MLLNVEINMSVCLRGSPQPEICMNYLWHMGQMILYYILQTVFEKLLKVLSTSLSSFIYFEIKNS